MWAYIGNDPHLQRKVLRISKGIKKTEESEESEPGTSRSQQITDCFSLVLGCRYLHNAELVYISRSFLKALNNILESMEESGKRHSKRIGQRLNTKLAIGYLLFNHMASLPLPQKLEWPRRNQESCLCVEIKPKCGYLPITRLITEDRVIKKHVSKFEMQQYVKRREGGGFISTYDPIKLFSNNRDEIRQAFIGLIENPQNNLRVFYGNSVIFPGTLARDSACFARECRSNLAKSLLSLDFSDSFLEGNTTTEQTPEERVVSSFIDLLTETLVQEPILSRLLQLQMLDVLDIQAVYKLHQRLIQNGYHVNFEAKEELLHQRPLINTWVNFFLISNLKFL